MYNIKRQTDGSVTVTEVGGKEPLYSLESNTILAYKVPGEDLEVRKVGELADDATLIRALMFKWTPL